MEETSSVDNQEEAKKPAVRRSRRAATRTQTNKASNKNGSVLPGADDVEVLKSPAPVVRRKTNRASTRAKRMEASAEAGNSDQEPDPEEAKSTLQCPDCNKTFKAALGLKYHMERKVCQKATGKRKSTSRARVSIAESPGENSDEDNEEASSPERKRAKVASSSSSRCPASDRTCPNCKKVFAIKEGYDYHVMNKVCERARPKKKAGKPTCPHCNKVFSIKSGLDYHLKRRVCLRQPPAASTTISKCNVLAEGAQYVTPYGIVQVISDNRATPGEAQLPDKRVVKAFSKDKQSRAARAKKRSMTAAIRTRTIRHQLMQLYENQTQESQDHVWSAYLKGNPLKMAEERVFQKLNVEKPAPEDPLEPEILHPNRIVECIQIPDERQILGNNNGVVARSTAPCGTMRLFLQRRLLKREYHADLPVYKCATCGADYDSKEGYNYHMANSRCTRQSTLRREEMEERLIAIEQGMQFKLKRLEKDKRKSAKQRETREMEQKEREEIDIGDDLENPYDVLQMLEEEEAKCLAILEASSGVTENQKKRKNKRKKKKKLRKRKRVVYEAVTDRPPPKIVDTQALVDEVDAGRYPTMKRFIGEHSDECYICKKDDGQLLYPCNFCSSAVHFDCTNSRYVVKRPEPEEDFMCSKCIQHIIHMRARAEKRRNRKLDQASQDVPEDDNDYHVMAEKGRELNELMELLKDAAGRLESSVRVSDINAVRRSGILDKGF